MLGIRHTISKCRKKGMSLDKFTFLKLPPVVRISLQELLGRLRVKDNTLPASVPGHQTNQPLAVSASHRDLDILSTAVPNVHAFS